MLVDIQKFKGAQKIIQVCADVILAVCTPRNAHGEEPPPHIVNAMRDSNVLIMPLRYSMTHASATKEARRNGTRVISMGDFDERMLESGGIEADFLKIAPTVKQVAEVLTKGEKAKVTTMRGTNLDMDISGRSGASEPGFSHEPGSISGPPNIEANVGPLEGSTQGMLIVDGSIPHPALGVIRDPISIRVENGQVTEITGGVEADKLRLALSDMGKEIYNIAELGIGLNSCSTITGSMMEDEGAYGTCHIGIGDNTSFGGRVKAKSHIDLIIRRPTIEIDGKIIEKDGKLVL